MAGRVEAYALANEMIWFASRPVSSAAHAGVFEVTHKPYFDAYRRKRVALRAQQLLKSRQIGCQWALTCALL
jgi:hypothetical protein